VRDSRGNPVVSKSNAEAAKRIAEATDGMSADEKKSKTAYASALAETDSVDTETRTETPSPSVEPFWMLALLSWFAAFAIQDKMPLWTKKPSLSVR
jgi:hypothetical protein